MKHRLLMSLAAVPVLFVTAAVRAQAPAGAPPAAEPPPGAPAAAPPPAAPEPPPPPKPAPAPPIANKFQFTIYGFGQLDIIHDTTQVLPEGAGHTVLPRPPYLAPDASAAAMAAFNPSFGPAKNGRTQMFGNNSRFGFRLNAPEMNGIKAFTVIEADFMGITANAQEASQNTRNLRLRHAYVRMDSDVIDVVAGQTWDVFGGAVVPHLPSGIAFHGLLGEVFHRNPQLRLSKTIKSDDVNVEIRVAAVRPVQNQAEIPDLQGALRLTLNKWKTIHALGAGLPALDGLTVDISGMYRFFKLNDFAVRNDYVKKNGWGASFNAFIPIVPATKEDQSNALALSIEASYGSGIADMWGVNGGLTAGAPINNANGFPPNVVDPVTAMPMAMPPVTGVAAVPYTANIDPAIVAYNKATAQWVPVKWLGLVGALQYRLPFEDGRVWVSATGSYIKSDNIADLAVMGSGYNAGALWKSGMRFDGSLMYNIYPAVVTGVMYETIQHTYVTAVNGDDKSVRNHRIHASVLFHF